MPNDDVRDALRQPNGEQLVRQAVENAKPWTPEDQDSEARRMTGAEMAAKRILDHQKGPPPRVPTGIEKLDFELGGGIPFGHLAVIGALSSHGKTALGMQIGHHNTKIEGREVLFLSLEMSLDQLADRTLSYASGIPASQWYSRNEHLEHDVKQHFEGAANYVFVDGISTLVEVEQELVRGFNAGIKVAIIDYCQFIDASSRDDTNSIMRRVSAKLKKLAKGHDAVIFALAQLHKRVVDRKPLAPQLMDIEYGSKLAHDADQVIFGLWPFRVDTTLPRDRYRLFIEKNRNGQSKVTIDAKFNPERMCVTAEVEPDVPSYRDRAAQEEQDFGGAGLLPFEEGFRTESKGGFYAE